VFSLFKKKATVDELVSFFILYIQGSWPGLGDNEEHIDFGDFADIDQNLFKEERKYLRTFAVDFGTALVFGFNNPKKSVILDTVKMHLLEMINAGKLPSDFMEKLTERMLEYTEAVKTPSNIGPHYNIGVVFASQFGYGLDSSVIAMATILFGSDIIAVKSLLQSIKITF